MIVIGMVTYNSLHDLPACVAGIRAQVLDDLRLIVADNASTDGSVSWLQEHVPEATLLRLEDNVGYGRAHNRILESAELGSGDFYLTLNPDVRLQPSYLEALRTGLIAHTADWGTGKLRSMEGEIPSSTIYSVGHGLTRAGFFFNIGHGLPDGSQFNHGREVFGAPGAAALYSAELIKRLSCGHSFFDPALFLYGEDTDIDWRARNRGLRCWYVPEAVAGHRGSQAGERLRVEAVANRYLSALKNAPTRALVLSILPMAVAHLLFRLMVTPRHGFKLVRLMVEQGPDMLASRPGVPRMTPAEFGRWIEWSRLQPTGQPVKFWSRLRDFSRR